MVYRLSRTFYIIIGIKPKQGATLRCRTLFWFYTRWRFRFASMLRKMKRRMVKPHREEPP